MRSSEGYVRTKKAVERRLNRTAVIGPSVAKVIKNSKSVVRDVLLQSATIFEDFGFVYLGPVDGHNLGDLEEALLAAKEYHRPVFLHVHTVKGKAMRRRRKIPANTTAFPSSILKPATRRSPGRIPIPMCSARNWCAWQRRTPVSVQ